MPRTWGSPTPQPFSSSMQPISDASQTRERAPHAPRRTIRSVLVAVLLALAALAMGTRAHASGSDSGSTSGPMGVPAAASMGKAAAGDEEEGRVIVLGFDGADWRTTERMMDEGALPNLAKLRDAGTAGPLVSTDPAESAAGWAAINTGANPAKNGVPSFIERKITGDRVTPDFAHVGKVTVRTEDLIGSGAKGGLAGLASRLNPWILAGVAGVLAFLVFRFLLRASGILAALIAIALGGAALFATRSAGSVLPEEIPDVLANEVQLDGFWVEAARAGHPAVALQAPMAFGRPGAEGARTLYGLGVPDVRASINGDWFIYTTDTVENARAPRGSSLPGSQTGTLFRVDFEEPKGGGTKAIETFLYGPLNFVKLDRAKARHAEISAITNDTRKFNELSFQVSQALNNERVKLEKVLREMAAPLDGRSGGAKEYLHRVSAPMSVTPAAGGAFDVEIDGTSQTLKAGEWSEFYTITFELGPLMKVHAITRACIMEDDPFFRLYIDTLQFDPKQPAFWQPTSSPIEFSTELSNLIESRFETLGWGCMTNQVKDKFVDSKMFLQDVEFTMKYRRRLMQKMLEDKDWRILYSVFSATDRVQHMMYRYADPEHPIYNAEEAATTTEYFEEEVAYKDAIAATYKQMDAIVGDAMAALGPDDTLILCADHGFTSFRRQVNVNNWLEAEGYLVLRSDLQDARQGSQLGAIDWSKTRAYGIGLGMIYLNLEGREPGGIVRLEDAPALMAEICERFLAARDNGTPIGTSAKVMKDVYVGTAEWGSVDFHCSDIMLGFAEFYRASWSSVDGSIDLVENVIESGGGAPERVEVVADSMASDNTKSWSGDHASNDPGLVTGIFFCNRKVTSEDGQFSVFDIAPTVLERVGAPRPAHFDRKPLQFQ